MRFNNYNNYNTFLIENIYHRLIIWNNNCPQNKTTFFSFLPRKIFQSRKIPAPINLPRPLISPYLHFMTNERREHETVGPSEPSTKDP